VRSAALRCRTIIGGPRPAAAPPDAAGATHWKVALCGQGPRCTSGGRHEIEPT
jgi:hypothetical protein